jgi:hypothetical protein
VPGIGLIPMNAVINEVVARQLVPQMDQGLELVVFEAVAARPANGPGSRARRFRSGPPSPIECLKERSGPLNIGSLIRC